MLLQKTKRNVLLIQAIWHIAAVVNYNRNAFFRNMLAKTVFSRNKSRYDKPLPRLFNGYPDVTTRLGLHKCTWKRYSNTVNEQYTQIKTCHLQHNSASLHGLHIRSRKLICWKPGKNNSSAVRNTHTHTREFFNILQLWNSASEVGAREQPCFFEAGGQCIGVAPSGQKPNFAKRLLNNTT